MPSNHYNAASQSENGTENRNPSPCLTPEDLSYLDTEAWDLIIMITIWAWLAANEFQVPGTQPRHQIKMLLAGLILYKCLPS